MATFSNEDLRNLATAMIVSRDEEPNEDAIALQLQAITGKADSTIAGYFKKYMTTTEEEPKSDNNVTIVKVKQVTETNGMKAERGDFAYIVNDRYIVQAIQLRRYAVEMDIQLVGATLEIIDLGVSAKSADKLNACIVVGCKLDYTNDVVATSTNQIIIQRTTMRIAERKESIADLRVTKLGGNSRLAPQVDPFPKTLN